MSVAVSTARAIIKQAISDEVYDGEMPGDEAGIISKAEELIEMAEQAWASNVRGPEVEKILRLAAADDEDKSEPETSDSDDEDSEPESDDESQPTDGIFSDIAEKLKKVEPYEGYADDRVSDITESLGWYFTEEANLSSAEQIELLQNTYSYEKAHKNRARILKWVTDAAVERGFASEEEIQASAESDSEPEAEQSEGSEGDSGAEERSEDEDAEDGDGGSEQGEAPAAEAPPEEPDAKPDTKPKASRPSSQGSTSEGKPSGSDSSGGSGSPDEFKAIVKKVDVELAKERVDIPKPPTEDAPELPWNWSEVSDADLQDYHMQFASFAYYKSYQRSRNDRIAFHCKEAADTIARELMNAIPKEKDFKVTVAEATIESDARVKRWRRNQKKYEAMANQDRQEADSYHKLVEALSRLESMRHNSYLRSQGRN